jgi:hypothetical protein
VKATGVYEPAAELDKDVERAKREWGAAEEACLHWMEMVMSHGYCDPGSSCTNSSFCQAQEDKALVAAPKPPQVELPEVKLPKVPSGAAPEPPRPPNIGRVNSEPRPPHLDLPATARQFVDANPPEIESTRPRPERSLSRGALGPRR